jgi:hypothetical protein
MIVERHSLHAIVNGPLFSAAPRKKRIIAADARIFVSRSLFFRRWQSSQTGPFAAKRLLRGLWNKKTTHHRLAFPFGSKRSMREHGGVRSFFDPGALNEMSRRLIGGHEQR